MIQKVIASLAGIVLLVLAGGVAYYYYIVLPIPDYVVSAPPSTETKPDNALAAGPITVVTPKNITIQKQDNTTVSFTIATDTKILQGGQNGQPGITKNVSDLKAGMAVLITPSHTDAAQAQIVLIIPPPTQ